MSVGVRRHVSVDLLFEPLNFCFVIRVGLEQTEAQRIVFPVKSCRPAHLTRFCIQGQHDCGTRHDKGFGASLGGLFHLDKDKPLVMNRRFSL
jgi:hypothetical protein